MEKIWKKVFDQNPDIIIVCSSNGTIEYVNAVSEIQLEFSAKELIGQSYENLFLDKEFDIRKVIEDSNGDTVECTTSIYRKNKTCFQVSIRIVTSEEDGRVIIYAHDDTELVRAHKETEFVGERAREAGKARDEFVANVTHELRTPVNGIKGHTAYLMSLEHDKEQDKELKIITECCLNMEKLINNILDFAKLEAGKFSINNHDFVFADFMRYIIETNGKLIEDKGLRFIVNVDETIPERLFGDDFRLTQVLNNLLSNALKFTQKGYIAVEVTRSMQYGRDVELFFMVMDTGIGIAPEKKDILFESFTQADASISRSYGGTGLGLAITKQIVELMNGSIRLESEYGKGSSFSFSVRMQLPEDVEIDENAVAEPIRINHVNTAQSLFEEADRLNQYGTLENTEEIDKNLEKLSICIELENFEKAEQFAENIKSLVLEGPPNLKPLAFKTVMMIRKEDLDNSQKYFDELSEAIKATRQ